MELGMKNTAYQACAGLTLLLLLLFLLSANALAQNTAGSELKKASLSSSVSHSITPEKYSRMSIELIKQRNAAHRDWKPLKIVSPMVDGQRVGANDPHRVR